VNHHPSESGLSDQEQVSDNVLFIIAHRLVYYYDITELFHVIRWRIEEGIEYFFALLF
jgi:hypothetical protein